MRKRTEPRITGLWFVGRSALALTDEQLDQIMRCAAPLHPRIRRVFVELVAYALRGKVIGDGEVWRSCATVLRESGMFDPPLESHHGHVKGVGKYARPSPQQDRRGDERSQRGGAAAGKAYALRG
jgi:hypothetical protein